MKFLKDYWVSNLKAGMTVNNILLAVISIEQAKTRSGSDYLKILLSDKTGTIDARVWDEMHVREMLETLDIDCVIIVSGEVVEYNGLQLHIHSFSMVSKNEYDIKDFIPSTSRCIEEMKMELNEYVSSLHNKKLREFLENIFSGSFLGDFSLAVGGRIIHHNYLGGLLEHTLEAADYCEAAYKMQGKNMSRDVLLAGTLMHDIGKVFEYDKDSFTFNITEEARMVGGHILLGRDYIKNVANNLPNYIMQHLEHMILSHHGKKEWGAVIEPQTLEAITLHHADLLSARVNQVSLIIDRDSNQDWTDYDRYLQRRIRMFKNEQTF